MLATPHTPTQLMQLRQPKPVGVFNEHDRRVGNINAHLNHGGGHQHVGVARRKCRHGRAALIGSLGAMGEPHRERGEWALAQAGELGNCRARCDAGLTILHKWADDVRLATASQLGAHVVIRHLALGVAYPSGGDLAAPRWAATYRRHPQIAIGREGQRAGDGRGGHVQQVCRHAVVARLLSQRLTLLNTKAVLLVNHHQPQTIELDSTHQQRLRAHHHTGGSCGHRHFATLTLSLRHVAGNEHRLNSRRGQQGVECAQVLFGERLGGNEDGGLGTSLHSLRTCQRRHHGLTRPHFPLQ